MLSAHDNVALPAPVAEVWDWQLDARCRNMSVGLFFPAHGLRGHTLRYHEEDAKAVCSQCPELTLCRHYALEIGEQFRIRGGLTTVERHEIRSSLVLGCAITSGMQ